MKKLKISNSDLDWHPKYFWIFSSAFIISYLISIILTPKVFLINGFAVTAGILTFPIVCILGDILTEVYGFNNARKVIWLGLFANLFLIILTQISILLPTSLNPDVDKSISNLFAQTPRIAIASFLAYLIGEFTNSYIISKMKIKQKGKGFSARAILSTIIGQFLDTIIVVLIAFTGILPFKSLITLIISSWILKIGYEILALPLTIKIVKYAKQKEGVEHFDKEKLSII